ncbi:unnamed protein product [Parnassius apollo]|uniref:(apollo) hypothetical protein n=1 Tax=Parnassius apollo TaxID=110799 RepID=A0A8S3Y1S4_PARAO|nr:unnamed protein product [Parnassius apollo]
MASSCVVNRDIAKIRVVSMETDHELRLSRKAIAFGAWTAGCLLAVAAWTARCLLAVAAWTAGCQLAVALVQGGIG